MKNIMKVGFRQFLSITVMFLILNGFAIGFDTAPHFDLTRSVLHERGFGDSAIKITQVENWLTDYYSSTPTTSKANRANLEKLHFDNLFTTQEVKNYWGWLTNNLKTATQKAARENDHLAMLTIIGIGLHSTQDFYSHSNWVENHSNFSNGGYQIQTFFSNPQPTSNIITGKYPADRTTGFTGKTVPPNAQIHGDYQVGVSKDSPVKPRWEESYIFAYYASHELVGAFESWAEEARPGFWNTVQQFQSARDDEALEYDLRAVRNISMWVGSKGADGHWKGNKSGYDPYFAAFSAKWIISKSSIFTKQISEGSLPNQLSQNLYTDAVPSSMPIIAAFPIIKRAIFVKTTLIKEISTSGCAPGLEKNGALCYPQCKEGFSGNGPVCWGKCPAGFSDIGAFCQKPSPYGRGVGYFITNEKKCNAENPQGCEKCLAMWYPKCKPGFHNVGCNVCSPDCPAGWSDTGTGCTKPNYGRGAGNALKTAEIDPLGEPDFYPLISIDGQTYLDRVLQNLSEFENPWFEIHFVDENTSEVPINIVVMDEDDTNTGGRVKDDQIDINPAPGKLNLDFMFRLRDGSLSGDISGIFQTQVNSFTTSGAEPDKNRAILKAFVTQFLLRPTVSQQATPMPLQQPTPTLVVTESMDEEAINALLEDLQAGVESVIEDEEVLNAISEKWESSDLQGKTKKEIVNILFGHIKTSIDDREVWSKIWESWKQHTGGIRMP